MTTQIITVTGTAAWAQVYQPDTFMNATKWKIDIFPENEDEWSKITKAGIQKKRKMNSNPDNGPLGDYIQFTRDAMKVMKGKIIHFTGPVITDEDGTVIVDFVNKETGKRVYSYEESQKNDIERRGKPVLIGNGSKVKVTIAVYDTIKGKGQRLESVQILDLVEYQGSEGDLLPVKEDIRTPLTTTESKIKDENKTNNTTTTGAQAPW